MDSDKHGPGRGTAYENSISIHVVKGAKTGPGWAFSCMNDGVMSTASHDTVRFLGAEERAVALAAIEAEGAVVVAIDFAARGRLAETIEESVERALAARGAAAPGMLGAG